MPGPPPMPEKIRRLRDYAGHHRPPNRREPKATARRCPAPPPGLSRRARAEWRRVVPKLHQDRLVGERDRALLAHYCELWDTWCEANRAIRKEGLVFVTDKGNVVQRPEVGIRNKAGAEMRQIAMHFGMSPAARSRIEVPDGGEDEKDPAARYFA